MEDIWSKIIKTTGSVGVVALLFYTLLNYVYSKQIVALFGSERMFVLTIIVIAVLFIIFLVAIIKPKDLSMTPSKSEGSKVTYKDNSTHNGDNHF